MQNNVESDMKICLRRTYRVECFGCNGSSGERKRIEAVEERARAVSKDDARMGTARRAARILESRGIGSGNSTNDGVETKGDMKRSRDKLLISAL